MVVKIIIIIIIIIIIKNPIGGWGKMCIEKSEYSTKGNIGVNGAL